MNFSNLLSHLIDLIGNVADAHTTALFELKENQLVMREHFTLSNHLNQNVSISLGDFFDNLLLFHNTFALV